MGSKILQLYYGAKISLPMRGADFSMSLSFEPSNRSQYTKVTSKNNMVTEVNKGK